MAEARVQATFHIEPFDTSTSWPRWLSRLEGAFRLFKVPIENKVSYLLHYIGPAAFDVICNKCAPEDPYEQEYNELVTKLQEFYAPTPLEIAENFRFQQRRQLESETILQYVAALQKLSINCNFGPYLKTALRNQFVFGMKSTRIQSRLLESRDLTFDKAVQLATSMEMSAKDTDQLQGSSTALVQVADPKKNPTRKSKIRDSNQKKTEHRITPNTAKNYTLRNTQNNKNIHCYRCGKGHLATQCSLSRDIKCKACGNSGHLQSVCFKNKSQTHQLEEILSTYEENVTILQLEQGEYRDKFITQLQVNNKNINFEVDSGAAVTIANKTQMLNFFPNSIIHPTNLQLITFCESTLQTVGFIVVKVKYKNVQHKLNIYLTNVNRKPLLGREWLRQLLHHTTLKELTLNTHSEELLIVNTKQQLHSILQKYKKIFESNLNSIKDTKARLTLKKDLQPVFLKHRTVPFKLLPLVEKELENLEKAGILRKVNTSEWATPIVPVLKKEGKIRICGDYSVTLNSNLIVDDHPLPTIDELFSEMAGGTSFSKIDLKQAYLQLEVREEDQQYLTLNTHRGLYRPTRLMYGIASAPAIWQREIENILRDIPGVTIFLDDIKVTGTNDSEHLHRLELVFQRLHDYNIKVNLKKSEFFVNKIEYCGYIIDRHGIHKDKKKVEAIEHMPIPRNVSEVRAFIGFVTYYSRFIKNLSTILYPLNKLLRKETPFHWTQECNSAFKKAKEAFQSNEVLAYYDPKLPLILASPYGVGAVLSHIYPDGTEKAIQYASCTLTNTQKKYAQIDKEAYSIIFGIKKFYQYLYGNKFILYTDHRPLVHIFAPSKSLPVYSAMRMQHYALFLRGFNYTIKYKNTKLHSNADCLSRLPIAKSERYEYDVIDAFQIDTIQSLPITFEELVTATKQDTQLRKILEALQNGKNINKKNKSYNDEIEYSLQQGVILRGHRVIIPKVLQKKILKELHSVHFGIAKMKMLARSYVWWSGIDADIEQITKNCAECNANKNNPPKINIFAIL